ncbi:deoxyhypusine synthase family protein [archaeon]|jgi:deoxyhypusine synthase|nr:deoxyhypusine synthase family protein [archaeon]MBT4022902.1 deoxyhypusine synthase family protein [archaeon]MBT4272549.1 deoxyhypusine synthase family protein [archaeon]MBT4460383.1 deoxyhypusine synthase family protein [archaeon]MBT4859014.1 deoxyhypusine synthase family protein [archaeon]
MKKVKDLRWKKSMKVNDLVDDLGNVGFQASVMKKAVDVILRMKKSGAKIYFTYTSNMVTSGLRGFFAQLIELKIIDVIVTTVGGIEEDIMKAKGEEFIIGNFKPDDVELYEKGVNRVGNLFIRNESYLKFEDSIGKMLLKAYKQKPRWTPSELFNEIGKELKDKNSILYQAAKNNIPIFCPGITDGAFGFHLFMLQQKHNDFVIDVVKDFENILFSTSHDEKKGLISLGGSISKHHAILSCLLNGGLDYAVYLTTARSTSGSMSGATTEEAKSWGKVKDDSDVSTVIGDVTFTFPLIMIKVLEELKFEGIIK